MTQDELRLAAAIMQAAANGAPLQYRSRRGGEWSTADPTQAKWNWGINEYKVAYVRDDGFPEPPLGEEWATIHGLTPEQFGVQDGWRPLTHSECRGNPRGDWMQFMESGAAGIRRGWLSNGSYTAFTTDRMRTRRPLYGYNPPAEQARDAMGPWTGGVTPMPQPQTEDRPRRQLNPSNLTPEQIGEGYRIVYEDEMDNLPRRAEFYASNYRYWEGSCYCGERLPQADRENSTYRVPV